MKQRLLSLFGLFLLTFNLNAIATTLYLIAPAESTPDQPYVLSAQGLNHSLLLAHYIHADLIPNAALNDVLFLTGNPEFMRSDAANGNGCTNQQNQAYLSNPQLCHFDTTPFATLDPTVIYYDKLIHAVDPTLATHAPQKLYPSSAHSVTDFAALNKDLLAYEKTHSTIILSWPRAQLNALMGSLTNCPVPAGFNGTPGQIVKMDLNGSSCQTAPTLINDGLKPAKDFSNILNQNTSVVGHLATPQDKYVVFIRHGEKWDNSDNGGELTCLGLNRALSVAYYVQQKYGRPDIIMGASLTTQGPESQLYASRALEKIMPYAILSGQEIRVLPINLQGPQLQATMRALVDNPNNKLIVFGWESANSARIANAMILNRWTIPPQANNPTYWNAKNPFYWNPNDYEQNIVLHYHCSTPSQCTLQNDYFINDEDYGDILPSWCGTPVNS